MPATIAGRRATFRALHQSGCFVMPNAWDAGSATRLARLGFPALASTSAGAAWVLGKEDGDLTLAEVLDHLRMLVSAIDLPINADFEHGFADTPAGVATSITAAIATGVAGVSIEDQLHGQMYDLPTSVARVAAARAAIDASGEDVMLIGRCEAYLLPDDVLPEVITRLQGYAAAGADCLFAPGVTSIESIAAIVEAVAPKPVSVGLNGPGLTVAELAAVGVRRISTGGALAKRAWRAFDLAAAMLAGQGTMPG